MMGIFFILICYLIAGFVAFMFLGFPCLVFTFICTRSHIEDRKAAQYWREKWQYGSVNDPEALLRAAEPAAPSGTLLRAGEQDDDQPEQLLRVATDQDAER
ncbi:MAG TPA: hypothetical protein VKT32_05360 [Chthonomonadaceae bacterium]|nr:hypothetical protein [Chthonomonadaceae bacterium]